jgi:hypothetical protein
LISESNVLSAVSADATSFKYCSPAALVLIALAVDDARRRVMTTRIGTTIVRFTHSP